MFQVPKRFLILPGVAHTINKCHFIKQVYSSSQLFVKFNGMLSHPFFIHYCHGMLEQVTFQ